MHSKWSLLIESLHYHSAKQLLCLKMMNGIKLLNGRKIEKIFLRITSMNSGKRYISAPQFIHLSCCVCRTYTYMPLTTFFSRISLTKHYVIYTQICLNICVHVHHKFVCLLPSGTQISILYCSVNLYKCIIICKFCMSTKYNPKTVFICIQILWAYLIKCPYYIC